MKLDTIAAVREFHERFDCVTQDQPSIPPLNDANAELRGVASDLMRIRRTLRTHTPDDLRAQRIALIVEELAELTSALADHNLAGTLDALVDLRYVCDGGALNFGLASVFDEAFTRVHASNMSKLGADGKPIHDEAGKIVKGPNYQPPRLEDLTRPRVLVSAYLQPYSDEEWAELDDLTPGGLD